MRPGGIVGRVPLHALHERLVGALRPMSAPRSSGVSMVPEQAQLTLTLVRADLLDAQRDTPAFDRA
jgi:hypothetical protein